ncbi:uncharacterized protein K02A2.6-like [Ischnura elegans]|uniref:uncharacterized protein K02A2.6-like n=1 Tax=Ischnura elegans TaxID=197161 RepID=UPI001ED88F33|nr:uncharacterized protein K02A2.6-like [Ischnura elegans]
MMLKLQPYRLNVVHTPGKYLFIADTLSRDFCAESCDVDTQFDDDVEMQVALLLENLPVTRENWELISKHASNDTVYCKLKTYISNGWPQYFKDVDSDCRAYFEFKDELVLVKGMVFRGDRIVIPCSLKIEMLKKLHTGHPGINRMMSRAEMSMFWLGCGQDIKKFVKSCPTCLKFQDNKSKNVLKYKKLPQFPWSEVGCDIFELYQKYYLVVVDALSNFVEVTTLDNLRTITAVEKMKSIFARHGIPMVVYTDGALCFDSEMFKKFAKEWEFLHVLSSPHYPKSNGLAESGVKSIKKIFKKALDSNEDPYLALLNFRNTPRGKVHSPASNLMSRNLRTNIPCSFQALIPKITYDKDRPILQENKYKSKEYYDRSAKSHPQYRVGQKIMFQKKPNSIWVPGTILEKGQTPRSYVVEGEEGRGVYKRNQVNVSARGEPVSLQKSNLNVSARGESFSLQGPKSVTK